MLELAEQTTSEDLAFPLSDRHLLNQRQLCPTMPISVNETLNDPTLLTLDKDVPSGAKVK